MDKIVLGLDIGIASVGWAFINESKGEVVASGVRVFPMGTHYDDQSKKETPKNAVRRMHRGRSRNIYRYKIRRKHLRKFLLEHNMLPKYHEKNENGEKVYYGKEFYQTRTRALDEKISLTELGRIWMFFNKHRGFKSNSLSIQAEDENEGLVKENIQELRNFMENHEARTVGEYFHKMYEWAEEWYDEGKWHNINEPIDERAFDKETGNYDLHRSYGIRREGRHVDRAMYEREFDMIWSKQKEKHGDSQKDLFTGSKEELIEIEKLNCKERQAALKAFAKTNYWKVRNTIIYYQRPLRSQKKYIGRCKLEPSKRCTPISSLDYQEFRIWKELSDVRYTDWEDSVIKQSLPLEWKKKLADYLKFNPSLELKLTKNNTERSIYGVLELEEPERFTFSRTSTDDEQEKISGNRTIVALKEALPEDKFEWLLKNQEIFEIDHNALEEKGRTLYHLWHHIHMANRPEWLKEKLMCDWGFNDEVSSNLLEARIEDGYGSYSSKAIKKLLPHFKSGLDEWDAKNEVPEYSVFTKARTIEENLRLLKGEVSPVVNNELRNPVVERAVSETRKIVNALLKEHNEILGDRSNFRINIEATRSLRKPRTEREKELRRVREADKRRTRLAEHLNKNKEKYNLNRNVAKYDSLINKYELFLELVGDPGDENFKEYKNIFKQRDREKHALWLECKRLCPYSERPIPLHLLFTDRIQIEHIIPYSISWDDSFMNKTLAYADENAEKGNLTAAAYMKKKGKLKDFEAYLKKSAFKKEKVANCKKLVKDEGFNGSALSNTSYIATAVRQKLAEVCLYNNISFTNGQATSLLRKFVWRDLGRLLDIVRYEEETSKNIEEDFDNFYRWSREFHQWRKKKYQTSDLIWPKWRTLSDDVQRDIDEFDKKTGNALRYAWSEVEKFYDFQNSNGKKDRTDHRHHTLDAFFVALSTIPVL